MNFKTLITSSILLLVSHLAFSQDLQEQDLQQDTLALNPQPGPVTPAKVEEKWYDKISIRGYGQVRFNGLQTNPDLECEQCDASWGGEDEVFLRRMRIIFYGNIHERLYFYVQPDFASAAGSRNLHFAQIRDAYFDLALDRKKEFRLRIGQSKIPYGFENMQSSQNRIPLDRNDPLNSAVRNERDLGAFFYWAPTVARQRFSSLVRTGLKGSGDYGVFALGAYNGQTANRPDENDNFHTVARLSYPFEFGNGQIIEPGIQAYTGKYVLHALTPGVAVQNEEMEYLDERIAATLVVYPQPFGLQTEYTVGTGPEYNPETNTVEQQSLHGGYVMANYMIRHKGQFIIPFTRYQYYDGGKKHELDARSYLVRELEIGVEWQPFRNFESVFMYTISDRTFEDSLRPDNRQQGSLLRIQLQFNF
jgi:hypothetical protein